MSFTSSSTPTFQPTSTVLGTTQVLGFTTSLLLSGIYFSSSQLTVPILYRLPARSATSVFAEFYHRGAATVVPLAVVSALLSAVGSVLSPYAQVQVRVQEQPSTRLLAGTAAVFTLATLPWTKLVMKDTIEKLLRLDETYSEAGRVEKEQQEEGVNAEVVELLKRWKWMNVVRAGFPLVGGLIGIIAFVSTTA